MKQFNIPNTLTLMRLIISPLMLPVLMVYFLPFNNIIINGFLTVVFIFFSLTDFFDGYFARRYDQETDIGKLLDPIADKFLLYSTLIALLAAGKLFFYWVIILIGREFFVMGLRQLALERNFEIPVSYLGKIKTTVQMICLTTIIFNPYQLLGLHAWKWNGAELFLLIITIGLSVLSAWYYYRKFMYHIHMQTEEDEDEEDI